jgi:hypothetical protein
MKAIGKVSQDLKAHASKAASKAHKGLAGGGQVSDSAYTAVMQAEKAGKKTMIDKPLKSTTKPAEKRYPSGLTDSDIDKVINSKEFQEGSSHFIDKKRGGKIGK